MSIVVNFEYLAPRRESAIRQLFLKQVREPRR